MGPMRRMARITGRTDDMLIIRGVNLFPSQIEEEILRCKELAPHYLLEVTRAGRLDELTFHVADERRRTRQSHHSHRRSRSTSCGFRRGACPADLPGVTSASLLVRGLNKVPPQELDPRTTMRPA